MGEYASWLTTGEAAELDKERIKEALSGRLMIGEDEDGFVYGPAAKEECDRFVLDAFDNQVHLCKQANAVGRAYERILADRGIGISLFEFMGYVEEESDRFNDYVFEHELDELAEEIAEFERGES
ncbi:MAG: hypothetical protein IJH87_04065 [Atopobiaceae bacterium]|nr:hypothetical protein [Atopobiaceae bacterium]